MGVGIRTPLIDIYDLAGIQPLEERLVSLRERAISKYDKSSKSIQDLAVLREVIVV